MAKLTHFNKTGDAHMVNVSDKTPSHRVAAAGGRIVMQTETLRLIQEGKHKKGDVLGIARIAGIMASKRTADLIPLCHPVPLTRVEIEFSIDEKNSAVECKATTETHDRTGVEIEAFCAVQMALLTVYDMCKSVDRGMVIDNVRLLHKSGGKSGEFSRKVEK